VAAVVPTPPLVTPAPPPDTTGKKDSLPRPVRTVGSLIVTAPNNATVSVNGTEAAGGWDSDSLKPGTYRIVASVPAPPGCSTATVTETAAVRATGRPVRISVSPRSCGVIVFTSNVRDARWTLESLAPADSGWQKSGAVPANVTLPAGAYRRSITKPKCGSYIDTVRATPNRVDSLARVNPDCS
jgi:hypothetical protein